MRAAFTEKLVAAMKTRRMGDPLAEGTDIGPQARPDLRDELHAQVMDSVAKGATLLLGGEIPPGKGSFYPPTVLADVKPGMPAYDEELFGPVASMFAARDEADAVRIANDSIFGLGRRRVHEGRGERRARRARARGRVHVRQHARRVRSAAAVRRHQGIGLRPRARHLRHQRVREHQDGVRK